MMDLGLSDLPWINACLNSTSAVFLFFGWCFIKKGRQKAHRNCMLGAFMVSTVFLICYLTYHYHVGATSFVDPAWFRPFYLGLLLSHVLLAVVIVPLILTTLVLAIRGRFKSHKKIARWTWPLWMYVSVTGVIIYALLYHLFPQARV